MPRPATKTDLLAAANGNFEKMMLLVDGMSDEAKNAAFDFSSIANQKEAHWKRDKNLRDVLVHLYEWHQLLLGWVEANQNGEAKPFIPAPYNWKTYAGMNMELWEKHQNTPLDKAIEMLRKSHAEAVEMIGSFSNEELFAKGVFPWTGTSPLGSYCVSATASHYLWATKKIKAHSKTTR